MMRERADENFECVEGYGEGRFSSSSMTSFRCRSLSEMTRIFNVLFEPERSGQGKTLGRGLVCSSEELRDPCFAAS